jgi:hypothetical protein
MTYKIYTGKIKQEIEYFFELKTEPILKALFLEVVDQNGKHAQTILGLTHDGQLMINQKINNKVAEKLGLQLDEKGAIKIFNLEFES